VEPDPALVGALALGRAMLLQALREVQRSRGACEAAAWLRGRQAAQILTACELPDAPERIAEALARALDGFDLRRFSWLANRADDE